MRFQELTINEVESSLGFGHGRDVARQGGSLWQQAQADADRAAAQRRASALPPGMTVPGTTADPDAPAGTNELPQPEGPGGNGRIIPNRSMNPLFTLNGQQSAMVRANAGEVMANDTLPRARRMAGIFGSAVIINDAIAKRGTSRENETQGSQHFFGRALDISVANMSNEQKLQLLHAALQAGFTGFGFGNNILHVDTGPRRHWSYGNSSYGGIQVSQLGAAVRSYQPGRSAVA